MWAYCGILGHTMGYFLILWDILVYYGILGHIMGYVVLLKDGMS